MREYWWIVLGVVLVISALGFLVSGLQSTQYSATAKVVLNEISQSNAVGGSSTQRVDPTRRVLNEVQRMKSPDVLQRAKEIAAGVEGADTIGSAISVSSSATNDQINVTANTPTAAASAALANAVVQAYEQVVVEQRKADLTNTIAQLTASRDQIQQTVSADNAQIQASTDAVTNDVSRFLRLPGDIDAEVKRRLASDANFQQLVKQQAQDQANLNAANDQVAQASLGMNLLSADISVVDDANVPGSPVQPKPMRNAALAAVIGLLIGVGIAWWRADRSVPVDASGIQSALGVPQFASLPSERRDNNEIDMATFGRFGNAGRVMSAALFHRLGERKGQTVLVTGMRAREGRTLTALTLAIAAARSGHSVVLIDADPESHGLTDACNLKGAPGLSEMMRSSIGFDRALHRFPMLDMWSLCVIPVGREPLDPMSVANVTSNHMVHALLTHIDVVIIDGPPLLSSATAVELAGASDWVLLTLGRDVTTRDIEEAKQRLALLDAHLIGFVTNELRHPVSDPLRVAQMLLPSDLPIAALPSGQPPSAPTPPAPPTPPPTAGDPGRAATIVDTQGYEVRGDAAGNGADAGASTPLGFSLRVGSPEAETGNA